MIAIDPTTITAVVSVITVLALIGGGFFWLGKLSSQVGQLDRRVDQMDRRIDQLDRRVDQLDKKVDQLAIDLRNEMRELRSELLEEMRRGNQQLLIALANHGHDDGGQPVFRVPVGAE